MYLYRNFRPEDLEGIMDLVSFNLGEYYPRSLYLEKSREWEDGFIVCVDNTSGRVIGMLLGSHEGRNETRVLMLAVDSRNRRKGIGTELMTRFIDLSIKKGARRVTLEVRVSNEGAKSFYRKLGFYQNGVLSMYYSNYEDGIRMVKDLQT
ncbi:MAG: N-acetyltransferase [Methanomassiliicoccales archaeon]